MAIILPRGIAGAHVFLVHSEIAFARGAGVAEMASKRVAAQQSMHVNQKVRRPVAFAQSRSSLNQFDAPCEVRGSMTLASNGNGNVDPANRPVSRLTGWSYSPNRGGLTLNNIT